MIERKSGIITTIAGNPEIVPGKMNNPGETDPAKLNLPLISSMDYYNGRLFVPVWYPEKNASDLIVLRKGPNR